MASASYKNSSKMFYFMLLVLLLCTAGSEAACSVCVASGNASEAECQHLNVSSTIFSLSDLSSEVTGCNIVHVYLTSGNHILTKNLNFHDSVNDIEIHGASNGQSTTIECKNAGIRFSENTSANKVFLSNFTIVRCNRIRQTSKGSTIQAAFYFKKALCKLQNVIVQDTAGYGLSVQDGIKQVISNCTFTNNTGNIHIVLQTKRVRETSINVSKTKFHEGRNRRGSGGINLFISDRVRCIFSIVNCEFHRNRGENGDHLFVKSSSSKHPAFIELKIKHTTFTSSLGYHRPFGASIESKGEKSNITVIIQDCIFSNNRNGALRIINAIVAEIINCTFTNNNNTAILIDMNADNTIVANITTSISLKISSCSIQNNTGRGIVFYKRSFVTSNTSMQTEFSNNTFTNNSRSLSLYFLLRNSIDNQLTKINECHFNNHKAVTGTAVVMIQGKQVQKQYQNNGLIIERSSFEGNQGILGDCSVLFIKNMDNLTLSDVYISDNNCTGITLSASQIKLNNVNNITRNHGLQGGALSLKSEELSQILDSLPHRIFSKLMFTNSSELNIINNTAHTYGGGIHSDETCENRGGKRNCFFQFEGDRIPIANVFTFSGNSANLGGDIVYGGCLSNCLIHVDRKDVITVNKSDPNNMFWKLVSFKNTLSQSTFIEYQERVAFCTNTTFSYSEDAYGATCNDFYAISTYRGKKFTVPMMIVAKDCFPSVSLIKAKVKNGDKVHLDHSSIIQEAEKNCFEFSYALTGGLEQNTTTIEFNLQGSSNMPPALLTVHFAECPAGYELNSEGQCDCNNVLTSYNIECQLHTYTLKIPAKTWVGEVNEGSEIIAVQKDCQYCKNDGKQIITNILGDSNELCTKNRHGIMCGACTFNNSLQLGGYECADCHNSIHKGVLLLVLFVVVGIALVLLLLHLNLTVSTGMINGLIFYSNIVYLNSDSLLPITRESSKSHLQNAVKILSTFQAWMNLDFGITTCFFDGYDAYISTWMQFVFPLYIWLLILIIVLASRYSSRIARITTSNTVSVLATLLLLAYAKLVKSSIDAASFTDVQLLDSSKQRVWILDGNIPYLQGKHVPLFLMGMFMTLIYILPFTLLILLGPLLQAKSHYRLLNWINKFKPFLDAFYGPYTRWYRYWPGILLLARMGILVTFTFYSLGDSPFKLMAVSVIVAVLLIAWMIMGKIQNISLHQKKPMNYLELFFLMNLLIFTVTSIYHSQVTKNMVNQQGLAVAMVGSVLVASCGILVHQIFSIVSSRSKAVRTIIQILITKIKRKNTAKFKDQPSQGSQSSPETESDNPTHSSVEMIRRDTLREPLLTN